MLFAFKGWIFGSRWLFFFEGDNRRDVVVPFFVLGESGLVVSSAVGFLLWVKHETLLENGKGCFLGIICFLTVC